MPLLFRISWIVYSWLLRAMNATKAPGAVLSKIKTAAKGISMRAYLAATAAFGAFSDEISAAKKTVADEARVFAAKWGIRKIGLDATESDLYELEQEIRKEKLGLITSFRTAASIVVRNGAEKAYKKFDEAVENASLEQVQGIANAYGLNPPQELSNLAKSQLKSAFRASFQKVRGQGEAAMQQAINDAAHKAKVVEQQMLERIEKAKAEASVTTKLMTTGLTISQIAKLRGRSTSQIQAMLANMKEGDGRATEWTKAQLQSVLKIREEQAARRAKLQAQ